MKITLSIFVCCLSLCLNAVPWSSAVGQNGLIVEGVSFQVAKDQTEKVSIKLNGPCVPKIYTMNGDNKPRLVIDLAGAGFAASVKPVVKGGDTLVKNIRIGVHPEPSAKVRIVLDLHPDRAYTYTKDFLKQENTLNVNLVPAEAVKTAPPAVVQIEAGMIKKKIKGAPKALVTPIEVKDPSPSVAAKATDASQKAAGVVASGEVKDALPEEKTPVKAEVEAEVKLEAEPEVTAPEIQLSAKAEESQEAKPDSKADVKSDVEPEDKPAEIVSSEPVTKPGGESAEDEKVDTAVKPVAESPLVADVKIEQEEQPGKVSGDEAPDAAVIEKAEEKPVSEQEHGPEKALAETGELSTDVPLLLDITYENTSSKGEMIFFHLNGFYPPNVSAIEGNVPQVVCEFVNMTKDEKIKPIVEAHGAYVQKIETKAGKDGKKLQVVLTLAPHRDYDLRQVFFKEDNLFVLVVDGMAEENVEKTTDTPAK